MGYERLKQRLAAGETIILDGPTGTELQRRGTPMDPGAWCGPATLSHELLLTEIHADYIDAGADLITANTFASSRLMLARSGFGDRVREINERAIGAALRARDMARDATEVVVAGSLSHMVPIIQGAAVSDAAQLPSQAELEDAFHELAGILAEAGCDLVILEMMYDPDRIPLALDAALATKLPVWFGASARRGPDGRPISFHQSEEISLEAVSEMIPQNGIDAAGIMHTSSEIVADALKVVRRHFGGALMAYPDSGYFEMPDWRFVDVIAPQHFEAFCRDWIASGVQIVGGCCGLTPEHIRAATRAKEKKQASRHAPK